MYRVAVKKTTCWNQFSGPTEFNGLDGLSMLGNAICPLLRRFRKIFMLIALLWNEEDVLCLHLGGQFISKVYIYISTTIYYVANWGNT